MDTRTALLDSAEHACRTRGYDGFSYADLAGDVGIRKASIHHHFPKKADLAEAVLARYSDVVFERLDHTSQRSGTAADALRFYVTLYREALADGRMVCLCVAFGAGRDSLPVAAQDALTTFHARSIVWLTDQFEQAALDQSVIYLGAPQDEAAACLALVEGAQLFARASGRADPFDEATAAFRARLVRSTH